MPFTADQFLDVFAQYHAAWPGMRWVLLALAVLSVIASVARFRRFPDFPIWSMAFMWFWAGTAYHLGAFSSINKAAYLFGSLFILQSVLLKFFGRSIEFAATPDLRGMFGSVLIFYSLVGYPIAGWLLGHEYPRAPSFGLPCPLTIFTFGLFLWARSPIPRKLVVIPILWSIIGTSATFLFGIWQDLGLIAALAIFTILSTGDTSKAIRSTVNSGKE